jgi:SnoaL-like domain
MNRFSIVAAAVLSLLAAELAVGRTEAKDASDVERVKAARQVFIATIAARDIRAVDKVWAHESFATFIGPLSTTVVVGWDGIRKAWEMRFGQFDRVTISLPNPMFVPTERLRNERVREKGWSLAPGFPPSNAGIQGGKIALGDYPPSVFLSRMRALVRSIAPVCSRLARVR